MACQKMRHKTVKAILDARRRMGDPYLYVYWCDECEALHLGHKTISRAYGSWDAAIMSVATRQKQQLIPKKMYVWKDNSGWRANWQPRPYGGTR